MVSRQSFACKTWPHGNSHLACHVFSSETLLLRMKLALITWSLGSALTRKSNGPSFVSLPRHSAPSMWPLLPVRRSHRRPFVLEPMVASMATWKTRDVITFSSFASGRTAPETRTAQPEPSSFFTNSVVRSTPRSLSRMACEPPTRGSYTVQPKRSTPSCCSQVSRRAAKPGQRCL